jgi:signal peptide peptidase SppA
MTTMRNPLLAARVFGTPLLMHPGKAAAIAQVFLDGPVDLGVAPITHTVRDGIDGDRMAQWADASDRDLFPVIDGVAVIKIVGSLVNNGAYVGAQSGVTSYQGVQAQTMRALRSNRVRGVIYEIDSMGGESQGSNETVEMIAEVSRAKPTMAIVASNACSAAYKLASQARRIVAPEDAVVGSVGSVIMHVDQSAALASAGVVVTFIHAGAHKVDGNPTTALPDDMRLDLQSRVDRSRVRFAEAVARGRPGLSVEDVLATEAACYDGPGALRLGLIDAVGEPSAAFAAFRAAVNGA